MMYADYSYYKTSWEGSSIAEADFPSLARESSALVDRITFGRLKGHPERVTEDVKNAVCAGAEAASLYTEACKGHIPGITAESVGSQSVSYESAEVMRKSREQAVREAIGRYLLPGDPLRYAGVCECW